MYLYMIKACANCGGKVAYKMWPIEVDDDKDMLDLEAKAAGWNCATLMRVCIELDEENQMGNVMTSQFLTDQQMLVPSFDETIAKLLGKRADTFMGGILLRAPSVQSTGDGKKEDVNEKTPEFPFVIIKSTKIM